MIKVSVMYPNAADATFDIDYYCSTHFEMVRRLLGEALKGENVDFGLAGEAPGEIAPFIAIGHLMFDSVDSFENAFGPNAEEILADIPNFTNTPPQIQISEIKI